MFWPGVLLGGLLDGFLGISQEARDWRVAEGRRMEKAVRGAGWPGGLLTWKDVATRRGFPGFGCLRPVGRFPDIPPEHTARGGPQDRPASPSSCPLCLSSYPCPLILISSPGAHDGPFLYCPRPSFLDHAPL